MHVCEVTCVCKCMCMSLWGQRSSWVRFLSRFCFALRQSLKSSPGWPRTYYVDQTGLTLMTASASQRLKVYAATPVTSPAGYLPCFLRQGLPLVWNSPDRQAGWSMSLDNLPASVSPTLGLQMQCSALLLSGCWEPNSGLLACVSSTLQTEPSPQPLILL